VYHLLLCYFRMYYLKLFNIIRVISALEIAKYYCLLLYFR